MMVTNTKTGVESQFVTFALGNEVFAVPVTVVREILDHEDVFKIPHGPDYLMGLRDVRGQGVPIVDLRLRLGMAATEQTSHTRVLVLDIPFAHRTLTIGWWPTRCSRSCPSVMRRSMRRRISACAGTPNISRASCGATAISS